MSINNKLMIFNLCEQIIAELDPIFIAEHFKKLDEQWLLIDEEKSKHIVEFNQRIIMPHLTTGWGPLANYYQITEPNLKSFTHLGHSMFKIHIFYGPVQTNEYLCYHRLTTSITRNPIFRVFLPDFDEFTAKLICTFLFITYFTHLIFFILY